MAHAVVLVLFTWSAFRGVLQVTTVSQTPPTYQDWLFSRLDWTGWKFSRCWKAAAAATVAAVATLLFS